MNTRVQLEQALAAQQRMRGTLPDDVVDATVFALRQQLAEMDSTEPEEQRKHVTVLFADLVGFTSLAERLDPEDVREIQNAFFAAVTPAISTYGGRVEKYVGDAVLTVFGAPQAHEDDPERAVLSALAMQQAMIGLNEQLSPVSLVLRIGIHTGLVISTVNTAGDFVVTGDTVNLASRLENAAAPGTVLISDETHKFVAHIFETEALAPIPVRGKIEPVRAFRVVASKPSAPKLRGIAGLDSPLVGRETELESLEQALDRLMCGEGGIITIVGEAGIGKSRLIGEIRQNRRAEHLQWITGRCLTYGGSTAYLLWMDLLRDYLGVTTEDAPLVAREVLDQQVHRLCTERHAVVYPYLSWLMALELEDETLTYELQGEGLRPNILLALKTLLTCAANERPLVLVCEDLHWSDCTSLELLEQLFVLSERVPLLFICILRPEHGNSAWKMVETANRLYAHRHTDLELPPLSTAESGMLVENLLRLDTKHIADETTLQTFPSQTVKRSILNRAEGNPFFMEEIIRSLMTSGTIIQAEDSDHNLVTKEVTESAIPDTLHGVLMARIDRLPQDARQILQLAAVVGRIVPYRVLATVFDKKHLLDQHVLILKREQMIREKKSTAEVEYTFIHHLTQEAAYDSMLKKESRTAHAMIAEALEQLYPERMEEQAGLLAQHWQRAEKPEKALGYILIAGDRAYRLGASWEAMDFYMGALKIAANKPPDEDAKVSHAHERLGDVYLVNLSRHTEALQHYQLFHSLAKSDEDVARASRKLGGVHLLLGNLKEAQKQFKLALARLKLRPTAAETGRVHFGLAYLFALENRIDDAEQHARASFEASLQISDLRGLADACRAMSGILKKRGDLEAACKYDEKSLKIYRELGDLPRTAQACNNVGDSCRLLGRINEALEYLNEGIELASHLGDTRDEATLRCTMAELRLDQGHYDRAIAHLEQALPLVKASGAIARKVTVHLILTSVYRGVEQWADARNHLESAECLVRDTHLKGYLPQIFLEWACLQAAQGEFSSAETYIQSAMELSELDNSNAFQGRAHHCFGYLYNCQCNWNKAVKHLQLSLHHFQQTHLRTEMAKAHTELGVAYASRNENGDRGHAIEHVLAAQEVFQKINASRHLAEISELMKTISASTGKSTFPVKRD